MQTPVARGKRRARTRATTLVEVLIVVAIIALVAGGVAVAAFDAWQRARQSSTQTNARALRHAAKTWRLAHDESGCPSFEELRSTGGLDQDSPRHDAWGTAWRIACTDNDVSVASDGRDREPGTADDIVVPAAPDDTPD